MKNKRKNLSLERREARMGYVFILPLILGVCFLFLPMLIKTVIFSFNDIEIVPDGYSLTFKGFEYYHKALFEDPNFNRYVVESLSLMVTRVPVIVLFSLVVATMLNGKFKGRIVARTIFFVPVLLATGIASGGSLVNILQAHSDSASGAGAELNQVREFLLSMDFNDTLIGIIASSAEQISIIVNASGLQIYILLTAFQEVPSSLYEASQVEGCSAWEQFWKITVPLVSPQILVSTIYTIIDSYVRSDAKVFGFISAKVFQNGEYSFATAMYVIYFVALALILGIVWLIAHRHIIYNE
ncbi:MAG: sugar ABC transporter permease [Clostridia bacterium]|nr:sugar ABC transporter permease [Clostridia bacterium]